MSHCPWCEQEAELRPVEQLTRYCLREDGTDPNTVPDLCHDCAVTYYDNWLAQWDEIEADLIESVELDGGRMAGPPSYSRSTQERAEELWQKYAPQTS